MSACRRSRNFPLLAVLLGLMVGLIVPAATPRVAAAAPDPGPYTETFRPQFHFTPAKNWMNDPNGLVYYDGEYHLFFQHNPEARTWGNISWGHAVSTDLVHWRELPLAIPATAQEMAWSGSIVVDEGNTTGFGSAGKPAMVAVFTAYDRVTRNQTQQLAYSTDRGRTWTRYANNPVLDNADNDFRDPKVFWHAETRRWVMVVVLALQRKVQIYTSDDLKTWTHTSDFGPANAIGGAWECPDLFPLPVDGDPDRVKWMLVVSLNPGGIAGGSGGQYFLGDFDGRKFSADEIVDRAPPPGRVFARFNNTADPGAGSFGSWTTTGSAFGAAPTAGGLAGQPPVLGYRGRGLANSYHGGNAATGTLTSAPFTIRERHINLLVGGGANPYRAATPDAPQSAVNLVVDGRVVRTAVGTASGGLDWASWDVGRLRGKTARIQVVDTATAAGGYVLVDHVMFSDTAARSVRERSRWLDYGKDYYAAVSWNDAPSGQRLMIGWMSNWQYASVTPTDPWRSAQSLVRQLSLRTRDGKLELVQRPVPAMKTLRAKRPLTIRHITLRRGVTDLAGLGGEGKALEIKADFAVGSARRFGLRVRTGPGEQTVIGYDTRRQELTVDRRRSGRTDFSPLFADEVQRAPLPIRNGRVRLHVFVDWSSVEVFAGGGTVTITNQIFPSPDSDGVELFSTGGRAELRTLKIWQLDSIWR